MKKLVTLLTEVVPRLRTTSALSHLSRPSARSSFRPSGLRVLSHCLSGFRALRWYSFNRTVKVTMHLKRL